MTLRVRHFLISVEPRKLCPAAVSDGFTQPRVGMLGEVEEGRRFPVLLPHEQQWNEGREQYSSSGQFLRFESKQRAVSFSPASIPDLIMILRKNDQLGTLQIGGRSAVALLTERGVLP